MTKEKILTCLKFLFPALIWLYLFRDLLAGAVPLLPEPFAVSAMLKFHLEQIQNGTFPVWNPYLLWGFPLPIILNYFGSSNPLWLVTLVLNLAGLNMYYAFLYSIVAYFLLGQVGFYQLAKILLKDREAAYVAFVLLLFSSIGLISIAQLNMLLIYVPAVWFFYFLVRFYERTDAAAWIGMTFTLMVIVISYLPLYFVTVFLLVGILACATAGRSCVDFVRKGFRFLKQRPWVTALSLLCLGASLIPVYWAYESTTAGQVVFPCRQTQDTVLTQGARFTDYSKTTDGAITSRMSVHDLFSNLDQLLYGNDGFFFVSIFAFFVVLLAAFQRVNRRIAFFALLFVGLLVLSIGNSTPAHRFLFEQVFYFRLMRNLHFFLPFLLSAFVLLAAEQWRVLLEWSGRSPASRRWLATVVVTLVHAGSGLFLLRQDNVIPESFVTVIASWIFFMVVLCENQSLNRYTRPVLLLACILIQPFSVIKGHNALGFENISPRVVEGMAQKKVNPAFSYTRPAQSFAQQEEHDKMDLFYWHYLTMSDAPVIRMDCLHGFPTFWSFYFLKNIPSHIVESYTLPKFLVYDHVRIIPEDMGNSQAVIEGLAQNHNTAFVSSDRAADLYDLDAFLKRRATAGPHPVAITGPEDGVKVRSFTANSITFSTDFAEKKFLVYNDSYMPGWRATVNAKPAAVYRANIAFKGLRLPAGRNEVKLSYYPKAGGLFYGGMALLYLAVLGILLRELVLSREGRR